MKEDCDHIIRIGPESSDDDIVVYYQSNKYHEHCEEYECRYCPECGALIVVDEVGE